MKHTIDTGGLVDCCYREWLMEHIKICSNCQTMANLAGQLNGYDRDEAFWKIGFKICLEMVDAGVINMAYLNRDGSNN